MLLNSKQPHLHFKYVTQKQSHLTILAKSVPRHLHALEYYQVAADEANTIHVHPPFPVEWLRIEVEQVHFVKPGWAQGGRYNTEAFENCKQRYLWYAQLLAEAVHINHKADDG